MPWKNARFQIALLVLVIAGGLLVWDSLPRVEMRMGARAYARNDTARAMQWFKAAATRGYPVAEIAVGNIYQQGGGVPRGYAEAMRWYQKAAAQGNLGAETQIAELYQGGLGVQQNNAEAMRWYQKAAAQGDWFAEAEVGVFYEYGLGVPKDDALAIEWYQKAAAQGDGYAKDALARLQAGGAPQ
jgi:hypothetical protein